MRNTIPVSDALSNAEEQIERAAKTIGRSAARRKVFEAIYHHKRMTKTVQQISEKTGLSRMRVLQAAGHLARRAIVHQTRKNGDTGYEKIDFFHAHKRQILGLAGNPKKLAALPTKRRNIFVSAPRALTITIPARAANVKQITVDDVGSFAAVKKMRTTGSLPRSLKEGQFKRGVQSVIGEPGEFKDWAGEKSDLFTTRLLVGGKRRPAAFAFKGPGERGKLVPARMGKNGDQALRLFRERADVYFVQHWREINPSIIELLRSLAQAKSALTGRPVWFGVIDGHDSERLRLAYPKEFSRGPRNRSKKRHAVPRKHK